MRLETLFGAEPENIPRKQCLLGVRVHRLYRIQECANRVQGYIQDPADRFKLPFLARYSAPGAVFDPLRSAKGGVVNFVMPRVPVVVHVATIFVLNQIIYRNVAGAHPQQLSFCSSIVALLLSTSRGQHSPPVAVAAM